MIIGSVLLALASLVVVAGIISWCAGVQLMTLVKGFLVGSAILLTITGAAVVTGDLLMSAGYLGASLPQPSAQSEPLTEMETQSLCRLHENTVGVFLESWGFGWRRLGPNFSEIVLNPKSQSNNHDVAWGYPPEIRDGSSKEGVEQGEKAARVHYMVESTFGKDSLKMGVPTENNEMWVVRKAYLIGLVKHPQPVVYLTDSVPNVMESDEVPMREPDAFEQAGLQMIQGGASFKIEKRGKELRMVAPLFAGSSCVKCHEQKGQLLGAFTYQLERVPVNQSEDGN